ncbi:hypothetical protein [Caballeronia arationis]|uniref:hypothetical protein n=1 Tax=Caballeronia arationis TaxID=1777142 RepID=UPI00117FD92D|nr:hypothetical protein [Caballeronia arationis]
MFAGIDERRDDQQVIELPLDDFVERERRGRRPVRVAMTTREDGDFRIEWIRSGPRDRFDCALAEGSISDPFPSFVLLASYWRHPSRFGHRLKDLYGCRGQQKRSPLQPNCVRAMRQNQT